jgi:hypothetical protein
MSTAFQTLPQALFNNPNAPNSLLKLLREPVQAKILPLWSRV